MSKSYLFVVAEVHGVVEAGPSGSVITGTVLRPKSFQKQQFSINVNRPLAGTSAWKLPGCQVLFLIKSAFLNWSEPISESSVFVLERACGEIEELPLMSAQSVVRVANEVAKGTGYRLDEYQDPKAHYELSTKDHTWTVLYDGKIAYPGSHFLVTVNVDSGEASLQPGE